MALGLGAAAILGGTSLAGSIASGLFGNKAADTQAELTDKAIKEANERAEREAALKAGLSVLGPELSFGRDLAFTGFEAFDPAARQVKSNRAMYNMIESGMSPDQVAWGRRMMGGFAGPNVAGKYRSQFNSMGA